MSETVYAVDRWEECFETAESRKYKTLTWIAERVDFDSTGWQQGLDEFGPIEWPRVYGNWMILLRTAAKAKTRGRLSGDKGEAWSPARIARPSGVDSEGIRQAFEFAVKIGWLKSVEISPGESPGDLPELPEKTNATERNGTEPYITKPNGTERKTKKPQPCRAVVLEVPETQTQSPKPAGSKPAKENRPAADPLHARVKRFPLLQALESIPVSGSGVIWHGSIFGREKLKADHIHNAPAAFWVEWYRNQLTASTPELRCGNQAELAFILAAVYAVRKCTETSLAGTARIARWIHWVKTRETNQITDDDFRRALDAIGKHFSDQKAAAAKPEHKAEPAAIHKPADRDLKAAIRRLKEREAVSLK